MRELFFKPRYEVWGSQQVIYNHSNLFLLISQNCLPKEVGKIVKIAQDIVLGSRPIKLMETS